MERVGAEGSTSRAASILRIWMKPGLSAMADEMRRADSASPSARITIDFFSCRACMGSSMGSRGLGESGGRDRWGGCKVASRHYWTLRVIHAASGAGEWLVAAGCCC